MSIIEMAWGLFLLVIGAALLDLILAKRAGARAGLGLFKALKKNPNVKAFLKVAESPEFENFIANSLKTMQIVNEELPRLLKEARAFLNPEVS